VAIFATVFSSSLFRVIFSTFCGLPGEDEGQVFENMTVAIMLEEAFSLLIGEWVIQEANLKGT
jgi:hypothetical protein